MPDPLDLTFAVLRGDPGPSALALTVRALYEADAEVQARAAALLLEKGEPQGFLALRRCFSTLLPRARAALAAGEGPFVQSLLEALKGPEVVERVTTVLCLGAVGRGPALQGLVTALEDPAEPVREEAARALAGLTRELAPSFQAADTEAVVEAGTRQRELVDALGLALRSYRQHRQMSVLESLLRLDVGSHRLLLNIAADPGDPRRDDLLGLLGRSDEPEAAAFLLRMLRDPRDRLHDEAARILEARSGNPGFQAALVRLFDAAPSNYLSRLMGSLKAVPWWPHDPASAPGALQYHLVTLLKEAKQLASADRIIKLASLLRLPDGGIRAQAALQLAELDDASAKAALWGLLNDPDEAVQLVVVKAFAASPHPERRRILASKLNHPSMTVQAVAREALSREGFHQYLASLPRMDEHTRVMAAQALAKLDPDLARRIQAELAALEPDRRVRALQLLNIVECGKEMVPTLLGLMQDNDRKVRASVVRSLGAAGSLDALRALARGLADPDRRVRANAIEAVGRVADPRMAKLLLPFLKTGDNRCRANAVRVLWQMGHQEVVAHLEGMLLDPSEGVRLSAVWVLGRIDWAGGRVHLERLVQADPSARVRGRAQKILGGSAVS